MKKILQFLAMGSLALLATTSQAGIIDYQVNAVNAGSSAGLNLAEGGFESDTGISVFSEKLNYTLTTGVAVDRTNSGSCCAFATPGTIAASTVVDSYLVHFDKVGNSSSFVELLGRITFDSDILGIIFTSSNLIASDFELGIASSFEGSTSVRGLELLGPGAADTYGINLIGGLPRNLGFLLKTNTNIDEIRVITTAAAPVPVPAAVWLFGSALLGLTGISRCKKS